MRVEATQLGYYNHVRRREGVIFSLKDPKHFSSVWMKDLDGVLAKGKAKGAKAPAVVEEQDEDLDPANQSPAPVAPKSKAAPKKAAPKKAAPKAAE